VKASGISLTGLIEGINAVPHLSKNIKLVSFHAASIERWLEGQAKLYRQKHPKISYERAKGYVRQQQLQGLTPSQLASMPAQQVWDACPAIRHCVVPEADWYGLIQGYETELWL
jgi:hypothetical protein